MIRMAVSISETALISRISSISSNIISQTSQLTLPTGQIVPISFHNDLNNLLSLSSPMTRVHMSSAILSRPTMSSDILTRPPVSSTILSRQHVSSAILTKPSGQSPSILTLEKNFISSLLAPSNHVHVPEPVPEHVPEAVPEHVPVPVPEHVVNLEHVHVSNLEPEPVPELVVNLEPEPVRVSVPEPEHVVNLVPEPVLKSNLKTSPNLIPKNIKYNEEVVVYDFEIDDGNVIKKVDYSKQNSIPLGCVSQKNEYYTTDSIRKFINDKWKSLGYFLK